MIIELPSLNHPGFYHNLNSTDLLFQEIDGTSGSLSVPNALGFK